MDTTTKTYCFDFDGTIADTLPVVVKAVNEALKECNLQEISDELLRGIIKEGIEVAVKKIGVPFYKLPLVYLKARKKIAQRSSRVTMSEEMREVLFRLKNEGHSLGVITSNSCETVRSFLEKNNVNVFDFIASAGAFNKKKLIKKFNKKGGVFIYVGDEPRDTVAGKKAGVKTVAVLWGLSSRGALIKVEPDIIIERPKDLLDLSF